MASSNPGSDSDIPESLYSDSGEKTAWIEREIGDWEEGAELRKGERAENDVVSRMERAKREVDEDGLEMTTEGANG